MENDAYVGCARTMSEWAYTMFTGKKTNAQYWAISEMANTR